MQMRKSPAQHAIAPRRVICLIERGQDRLDPRKVFGAGLGQLDGARGADHERGAELFFQFRDYARGRGLRQAKLAPGRGKTAGTRDAREQSQSLETIGHLQGEYILLELSVYCARTPPRIFTPVVR